MADNYFQGRRTVTCTGCGVERTTTRWYRTDGPGLGGESLSSTTACRCQPAIESCTCHPSPRVTGPILTEVPA